MNCLPHGRQPGRLIVMPGSLVAALAVSIVTVTLALPPHVRGATRDAQRNPPGQEAVLDLHSSAASLSTVVGESGMEVPLGGDDVVIATEPVITTAYLQIAQNGDIYVALDLATQVDVYRSTDGGDVWDLWTTFDDPGATSVASRDFLVAEGTSSRAFIAYRATTGGFDGKARVAYADITAATPSWTIVTVLDNAGVDHGTQMDIDTDAVHFPAYYVYLAVRSVDGNGDDLWFARSTNQGGSYSLPYKVVDNTGGADTWFADPLVRYGANYYIHLSYLQGASGTDGGVLERRATNTAALGLASWESPIVLDAMSNGVPMWNAALRPSAGDGDVFVMLWSTAAPGLTLRYSTDFGASWPGGNQGPVPVSSEFQQPFELLPAGAMAVGGILDPVGGLPLELQITRSNTSTPLIWTTPESLTRHDWQTYHHSRIAADPTRDYRLGAIWKYYDGANYVIRFDAEWRRDPGYPNTDIGFPLGTQGGGQTPPAVAEIDGDPELEIVFGTIFGDIYVINHDGTTVPGWPVNIGSMPIDAPVAVGDLVGNRVPSIVAGNTTGDVYAFKPDGTVEPGWPVAMNEASNVYVSIGALGPPNPRYVVALCGHEMRAIRYDGTNVSPLWGTFGDVLTHPAAIGDVDNDGVAEIVTLKGSFLHIHNLSDFSSEAFRNFPGEVFSDAPTLADFDLDGTLEIAAPTMSGKMYLVNHDGTDFSVSWPITVSPGIPLTAAALGDFLGGSEVEMAFAEENGAVHIRWYDGVEQASYPKASGSSALYMPPILSPVNISVSNVNIGTTDGFNGTAQSWRNLGMVPAGWPKNLSGPVEETFASGDIDNDGRNELVVLGVNFLTVLDVGVAPAVDPREHWPMYGYDAQRTGCLACEEILTAVGDPAPGVTYSDALDAHPNPFNPSTVIEYEVGHAGRVSLGVYDVAGRRVVTLIDNEHREAGRYTIPYSARTASGLYFVRLETADGETARKIALLK